jgi:hypothetical protein
LRSAHKVALVLMLLFVFSCCSSAQTGLRGIGPTGAQVAAAAVGVAAVTLVVLYVTLHKPVHRRLCSISEWDKELDGQQKQSHIHTRNQRRDQAGRTSQAVRKEEKGQRWPSQLSREEGKAGLWPLPAMKISSRCMSAQNSAAYLNGLTAPIFRPNPFQGYHGFRSQKK